MNGKLRDRLEVPAAIAEDELVALARASERVRAHLNGGEPRKTIVVPGQARQLRRLAAASAALGDRACRSQSAHNRHGVVTHP